MFEFAWTSFGNVAGSAWVSPERAFQCLCAIMKHLCQCLAPILNVSNYFWVQFGNNLAMCDHDSGQSLATPRHHSRISMAMPDRNCAMSRRYSKTSRAMLGRFSARTWSCLGALRERHLLRLSANRGLGAPAALEHLLDITCHASPRSWNCCEAILNIQRCPGRCLNTRIANRPTSQAANQPACQPVGPPAGQPANQNSPASLPASQPASEAALVWYISNALTNAV